MPGKKGRPRTNGPTCGANAKNGPCGNPAGMSTSHLGYGVCWRHGGRVPNHQKHAERLMAEEAARQFGVAIETTAEEALLKALARAQGYVLFYRERVAALTEDQMVYATERITRVARPVPGGPGVMTEDVTVAKSQPNVWVKLLTEAEKHLLAVAGVVASLNIEKRRVAIAEEQGEMFYQAMERIVEKLGLAGDPRLPVIVAEVINELTAP